MKNINTTNIKCRIFTTSLNELVKDCIEKAGNIKQLAEKSGICRMTLYRLLGGKPYNIQTKKRLEKFLKGKYERKK